MEMNMNDKSDIIPFARCTPTLFSKPSEFKLFSQRIWKRGAEFLDRVTKWAVLIAAVSWTYDIWMLKPEREHRQRIKDSWTIIYQGWGKSGEGGRIEALEYLVQHRQSLAHINLDRAQLVDVNLEGANLSNAHLRESNLTRANLEGAILNQAHLEGATLTEANLVEANLERANLKEAILDKTNLEGAILTEASLTGAQLNYANLTGADLDGANLAETFLNEANLNRTHLRRANLAGAYLPYTMFIDANLMRANFQGANLIGVHMVDADLNHANFEGADLRSAYLEETNLLHTRFIGADLRNADLSKSYFSKTDLRGADLRGAILGDNAQFVMVNAIVGDRLIPIPVRADILEIPLNAIPQKNSFIDGEFEGAIFLPTDSLIRLSEKQRIGIIIKTHFGITYDMMTTHDNSGHPLPKSNWKVISSLHAKN